MTKYIFSAALALVLGSANAQFRTSGPETFLNIDATGTTYTYFSIKKGIIVPAADSASTNWDIAVKGTAIKLNSTVEAQVVDQYFKDVKTAPALGYSNSITTASLFSVNAGIATVLVPKTIVLKYADNSYAKAEILSYKEVKTHNTYGAQGYYSLRYYHNTSDNLDQLFTQVFNLFSGYDHFQLFNLASADTVAPTDSATKKWDIGFNTTNIIINSGTSGPDEDSTQILSQDINTVISAPLTGYHSDNGDTKAIPGGSGNGWYTYDITVHSIKPTPNKTIVVKTSEGRYAKIRIDSYYKDAPANPNFLDINTARYYTFTYLYQPDGSNDFGNVSAPTVGVTEKTDLIGNISIAPNPAKDQFSINWEKVNGLSTIRILNIQGTVVKEVNTYDNQLTMEESLTPGLYLISISSGSALSTSKLFVY